MNGKTSDITEEIPYNLPDGWRFCRLSTICWLEDAPKQEGEKLPYLDAKAQRGGEPTIIEAGRIVEPQCRVILVDGENSGEIFTIQQRGYLGSTFKILRIVDAVNQEWLHLLLDHYRTLFKGSKVGAAIPHLNKNLFKNLIVGLPPVKEQQRIALVIKEMLIKLNAQPVMQVSYQAI